MKKSLDIFIWAILLFLITPSGMALASWNAVPGDYTYSWKLSLEKVLLLFLSPSNKLQSSTQVKIAERRYSEFEQVLDSEYAIESLDNLNKQLETTSSDIQKISQTDSRDEVTDQYIVSLKKMSAALSEQKVKAKTGEIAIVTQKETSTSTIKPIVRPTVKPTIVNTSVVPVTNPSTAIPNPTSSTTTAPNSAPTVAPVVENLPTEEENVTEVIDEITKTEENINQVIAVLEQEKKQNQDRSKSDNNPKEKKDNDERDNKDDKDNKESRDDKDNRDNKDKEDRSRR